VAPSQDYSAEEDEEVVEEEGGWWWWAWWWWRRLSLFVIQSQMRIGPTRIRRNTDPFKPQVR